MSTVKLSEIVGKVISGEWGTDDATGMGIPVLRTTNFTNEGLINFDDVVTRNIPKKKYEEKALQPGDIIIEKSGGSDKQPVGRVVYFDDESGKYLFNNFTGLLRIKDRKKWTPKYIFYSLYANYQKGGTRKYENKTTGLHNLKTDLFVKNLEIKKAPLEEQIKTVSVLDKLNELIQLEKKQLQQLDILIKSEFVEMFGNPITNSHQLPLEKLSDLGLLERGRSKHRPRNAPELLNGPYPLIQTGDVSAANLYITDYKETYSEIGLKQSKMWKSGTLCITIAANIAQTAILSFDACFPDSVVGFIPNGKIKSVYLHYWFYFLQKILDMQAPQVAQKNINLKILSDLKVTVPSLEEQNQFAAFVQQVDKSELAVQQSLEQLETLKKSLMQEYFG